MLRSLSLAPFATSIYTSAGGTGTGKSKFLEHLIRQDILAWRKSRCGLLLLDPHGCLYDNLLNWLAWHKIERPIDSEADALRHYRRYMVNMVVMGSLNVVRVVNCIPGFRRS